MHVNTDTATFTATIASDSEALPATPRRYFETIERGGPLDVQAVICDEEDGGPIVYVGDAALSPTTARALAAYLVEVVDAL